jgi:hypothetical protein
VNTVTSIAAAIKRAVNAHGAPNRFAVGELHREYGGPRPMDAGLALGTALDAIEQASGYRLSYEPGKPSMVSVEPPLMTLHDLLAGASDRRTATMFARVSKREAYQFRIYPDGKLEGRRWIDQSGKFDGAAVAGTARGFVGWSRWSASFGFSVESVLASDWIEIYE